jgi:hypothetical protein
MVAVRQRVSDQLLKLNEAVAPEAGPNAEELLRIEYLQFELGQLEKAFDDAEQMFLTHEHGSDPTSKKEDEGEEDNG